MGQIPKHKILSIVHSNRQGTMFLFQYKYLESFHSFNLVRKHEFWGPKAITRMIHILLHYQELNPSRGFEDTASAHERHYMMTARMLLSDLQEIETDDKSFRNTRGYVHFYNGELGLAVKEFSEALTMDKVRGLQSWVFFFLIMFLMLIITYCSRM